MIDFYVEYLNIYEIVWVKVICKNIDWFVIVHKNTKFEGSIESH
jgi:hypothetical protein